MRLLLRQRIFSWFDSFDIYNDAGAPVYTVQGKLSWGHKLEISDASGRYRGTVQERVAGAISWRSRTPPAAIGARYRSES